MHVHAPQYSAGHMIGGTIWRIAKETDDIIYAVDYNLNKEGHLDGTVLMKEFKRPSLLITDCYSASFPKLKRKDRDSTFLDTVRSTVGRGGNVLIPFDPAGNTLAHSLTHLGV